jgi:hypothetical protein
MICGWLYRQGADDLDFHRASSSGSATMLSLRRAWLVKDADDPSIFSAFGKKQAAQTFAPAAGCRLAVVNPHPQKQNVRRVVSRAGSRNNGWANRRLRVRDGVFPLGIDGEGKFLDKNYSGDESKFLWMLVAVSMPIGLILCYSTEAPQSNLVIKSPRATRAGTSESSRTDLPNLQIPCSSKASHAIRGPSERVSTPGRNPPIGPLECFEKKNTAYLIRHPSSISNPSFLPPFRTVSNHHLAEGHGERQEMGSWVERAVGGP